jgi:transcriptional regulator with XRE-family HTH domain
VSLFPPSINESAGRSPLSDDLAALRPAKLVLDADGHVGAALRRARESLDLDVEDIALATHIRAPYIAALENQDLDALPARPFAVGYVKAYARALGVDQDAVVARFRREAPDGDTMLRAPLGAQFRRGGRFGKLAIAALAVVAGLAGWNLLVHIRAFPAKPVATTASVAILPRLAAGPALLGAPLPAPPEASTPPPYETPGLAAATAVTGPDAAAAVTARIAAAAAAARPTDPIAVGAPFLAHGAIYGAAKGGVILQAIHPMSLVVRGGGGVIYFARQLAAGESWRAPAVAGLTADVDEPPAVEVYVDGKAVGQLTQPQTPVGSMTEHATLPN